MLLPESSFLSDLDIVGQQEVTSGLCLCGFKSLLFAIRHAAALSSRSECPSDVTVAVSHLD